MSPTWDTAVTRVSGSARLHGLQGQLSLRVDPLSWPTAPPSGLRGVGAASLLPALPHLLPPRALRPGGSAEASSEPGKVGWGDPAAGRSGGEERFAAASGNGRRGSHGQGSGFYRAEGLEGAAELVALPSQILLIFLY